MAKKYTCVYCWVTEDSDIDSYVLSSDHEPGSHEHYELLEEMWFEDYGNRDCPDWECVHSYVQE